MTDLAAQIRAKVQERLDENYGVHELASALLAVLDATDPGSLPPNGCGGDGCLALWVRHVVAEKLGIEVE